MSIEKKGRVLKFKKIQELLKRDLQRASMFYRISGLKCLIMMFFAYFINSYIKYSNGQICKRYIRKHIHPDLKNEITIKVNDYKMIVDTTDKGLSEDLIIHGIREYHATKFMKKFLKSEEVVVDIGANIGYYVILESKIIGSEGTIYAIEPVPRSFELLQKNIILNECNNVITYQYAIGDRTGTTTMNVGEHLNLSTIHDGDLEVKEQIRVNILTLDNFLSDKRSPDLIRMDVEGYEYEIIKGMKETLMLNKPLKLFIEMHFNILGKDKSGEILRILQDSGFEVVAFIHDIKGGILINNWGRRFIKSAFKMQGISKPYDIMYLTINDILENDKILSGYLSTYEIFFAKNIEY